MSHITVRDETAAGVFLGGMPLSGTPLYNTWHVALGRYVLVGQSGNCSRALDRWFEAKVPITKVCVLMRGTFGVLVTELKSAVAGRGDANTAS